MAAEKHMIVGLALALATAGALAAEVPEAVSPGLGERIAKVSGACPTFSWAGVAGARLYELVVYEAGGGEGERPAVTARVPGTASSWTPALGQCLDHGSRYAWFVRAVGESRPGKWSKGRLFEVAAGPTAAEVEQALAVLRRYMETGRERPGEPEVGSAGTSGGSEAASREAAAGARSVEAAGTALGGADFSIDTSGNVAGTSFAGDGSQLTGLDASNVTTGTLAEPRIDELVARDSEILPTVLAGDGSGSGLNADRLDGSHASAFARLGSSVSFSSIDASGNVAGGSFSGDGSGLTGVAAATAAQLAADGSNCLVGWAARGIDSWGQAQGCSQIPDALSDLSGSVQSSQLTGTYSQQLTLGNPLNSFVGDGSGLTGVAASSATQLAANGGNCSAGFAARGVDASGHAEFCFDTATQTELNAHKTSTDHNAAYVNRTGDTMTGSLTLAASQPRLRLNTSSSQSDLLFQKNGANRWSLSWNQASGYLFLYDWLAPGGTRMVIDDDTGNMGIGTASPGARLDVMGAGTAAGGVTGYDEVMARFKQTVPAKHSAIVVDALAGQDSIIYLSENGQPQWGIRANNEPLSNWTEFDIRYHLAGNNHSVMSILEASGPPPDDFEIILGGQVIPSVDNSFGLGGPGRRWKEVWAANPIILPSDSRLKNEVRTLGYGLSEVLGLRPVSYVWRDDEDRRTHLGLIAQEVAPLIPEAVRAAESPDDTWSMTYSSLIPVLIKATQEQQVIVEQLRARIEVLEGSL